jgi:hypothetical protein
MSTDALAWARKHPNGRIVTNYEVRLPFDYPVHALAFTEDKSDADDFGTAEPVYLLEATDCLMLVDEAGIYFNSRLFGSTPQRLIMRLMQVRKHRLDFRYSAQKVSSVDKILRDLTFESVHCHSFVGLPLVGGFGIIRRAGIDGKVINMRWVFREHHRDALYDTYGALNAASYYQEASARRVRR